MLISNKIHSFRNFREQIYNFFSRFADSPHEIHRSRAPRGGETSRLPLRWIAQSPVFWKYFWKIIWNCKIIHIILLPSCIRRRKRALHASQPINNTGCYWFFFSPNLAVWDIRNNQYMPAPWLLYPISMTREAIAVWTSIAFYVEVGQDPVRKRQ